MRPTARRGSRAARVFAIGLVAVLVVVLVVAGYYYDKFQQTRRDAVPVVAETTPTTQPGVTTATTAETTLPPIVGDPSDLGVDYDPPVAEQSAVPIYKKDPIDPNVINIAVMSSDARPGETIGRSDSMLIVSFNRQTKAIKIASVMRDNWVPIKGHGYDRINAAFAYGGVGLAVNTLNDNFGLDIQNYVTIRFEQFIMIIDQIGGVSVNLDRAEIDYINHVNGGLDTTPGVKLLNGAQALTHCRDRHVGNGDFDRTRRQREVVLAILQKVRQQRSPLALARLVAFTLDHVKTNMQANLMLTLGQEGLNAAQLAFEQVSIPFENTWHYANESGRSVIAIDIPKNRALLKAFLYGG